MDISSAGCQSTVDNHPLIRRLMALPNDTLLTSGQLSAIGFCGDSALHYLRKSGGGPRYVQLSPKVYLYAVQDVIDWLKTRFVDESDLEASRAVVSWLRIGPKKNSSDEHAKELSRCKEKLKHVKEILEGLLEDC